MIMYLCYYDKYLVSNSNTVNHQLVSNLMEKKHYFLLKGR